MAQRVQKLPTTIDEWVDAATSAGLIMTPPVNYPDHQSGSKVGIQQFLTYRTLVVARPSGDFSAANFGLAMELNTAGNYLTNSPGFVSYISNIMAHGAPAGAVTGDFALVSQQQQEIMIGRTIGNKLGRSDESPVNATFISLLQCVANTAPNQSKVWRFSKIALVANFGRVRGEQRKLTAVTDGQMQEMHNGRPGQIRCLLESKRLERRRCGPQVDMQETALMIAWIKEFPGVARRVLVSQNGVEFYITFAECAGDWARYLRNNNPHAYGMMTMHRFGPWYLNDARDMEELCGILLAITL